MCTYITFDRLRLSLPATAISILQPEVFTTTVNGDGVSLRTKFEQNHPFYYNVTIDYYHKNTIVEFSGKALLDSYPSLISYTNITTCFENINRCGVCHINTEQALQQSYVVQCDVTSDVLANCTVKDLYQNLTIQNNRKWGLRDVTSNRFTIESTVTTKRKKARLVIYDKGIEMSRKPNEAFLATVSNPDEQLAYFKNKIRYELNLNSLDRIRHVFGTDDNRLATLLYSAADPIDSVLNEIVFNDDSALCKAAQASGGLRILEHLLLLSVCDYDIQKVERVIRDMYAGSRSITRALEPYQNLYHQLIRNVPEPKNDMCLIDIRNQLRYMLSKTFGATEPTSPSLLHLYHSDDMNKKNYGGVAGNPELCGEQRPDED